MRIHLLIFIFFTDQFLKLYFLDGGVAEVNHGIALGLFSNLPVFFYFLVFILLSIIFYLLSSKNNLTVGFALIYIGATSNLLDRVIYGGVVDYINFLGLFKNNLGDIMIFDWCTPG